MDTAKLVNEVTSAFYLQASLKQPFMLDLNNIARHRLLNDQNTLTIFNVKFLQVNKNLFDRSHVASPRPAKNEILDADKRLDRFDKLSFAINSRLKVDDHGKKVYMLKR